MDLLLATLLFTPGPLSFLGGVGSGGDWGSDGIIISIPNVKNALVYTNIVQGVLLKKFLFLKKKKKKKKKKFEREMKARQMKDEER